MQERAIEEILKRIDAYGTEEGFAKIVADALALAPEGPERDALRREIGVRCGKVPPSTVDRWADGSGVPGENVRRFVLDRIREILANRS